KVFIAPEIGNEQTVFLGRKLPATGSRLLQVQVWPFVQITTDDGVRRGVGLRRRVIRDVHVVDYGPSVGVEKYRHGAVACPVGIDVGQSNRGKNSSPYVVTVGASGIVPHTTPRRIGLWAVNKVRNEDPQERVVGVVVLGFGSK